MTKEFEKLTTAFENETQPRARKSAKDMAMRAAMEAFEEKNQHAYQGNQFSKRLKRQGNKIFDLLTFSEWRKSMKLSYLLAGGTSLAVLTLAVANTGQFQELLNPREPVIEPAIITKPAQTIKKAETEISQTTVGRLENTKSSSGDKTVKAKPPAVVAEQKPMMNQGLYGEALRKDKRVRQQMAANAPSISSPSPMANIVRPMMAPKKRSANGFVAQENGAFMSPSYSDSGRDKFSEIKSNPLKQVVKEPVSTFSIDVDTASYSFMRAAINRGVLPQKDAVRVEELINYFPYDYQGPESKEIPFKANITVVPTPWNTATKLVHIGIKGYDIKQTEKPKSNLVFLLDTSGSMNAANKLPLLKNSFKLLLSTLSKDDTVSIVAYAGSAGVVLEPTKVKNKAKILAALDRLNAGGSTAGGQGIRLAYQLAQSNFDKKGVNRVILATDGDFNVGIRNQNELKSFIERKRKSGVMLSVLGFGMGNYNDALMQTLAQNGNGNAAYIDSLSEARKVLVQEASSTLFTIAKDVKIQMEFNPLTVKSYRLIGYETRKLNREDFNNDKVDAGDIGSGHTVTAIYEITPVGSDGGLVDPLRYGKKAAEKPQAQLKQVRSGEYGFLKLRYKLPKENVSRLVEAAVKIESAKTSIDDASIDVRFSTAVAAYGQLLRGGDNLKAYSYDDVINLASSAKGRDEFGYRAEFLNLVRLAKLASGLSRDNN